MLFFCISEYIVLFGGYYSEPKRAVYVGEALSGSHIPSWEIVPRNNPAREFPSDFSVVRVSFPNRNKCTFIYCYIRLIGYLFRFDSKIMMHFLKICHAKKHKNYTVLKGFFCY